MRSRTGDLGPSIVIPFRSDGGRRAAILEWTSRWWAAVLPQAELHVQHWNDDPFCVSAARNDGVAATSGSTIIVTDVDSIVEPDALRRAVEYVDNGGGWAFPYTDYIKLSEETTLELLGTDPVDDLGVAETAVGELQPPSVAGCYVIARSLWDSVNGQDERFLGWGLEDVAFARAVETLHGPAIRFDGSCIHLNHPRSRATTWQQPLIGRAQRIVAQYDQAQGDQRRMARLVTNRWTMPGRRLRPRTRSAGRIPPPTLRVCVVLYENEPAEVERCLRHLGAAVLYAQRLDRLSHVEIEVGDNSPTPVLDSPAAEALARSFQNDCDGRLRLHLFESNLGSAGGNQALAANSTADFLLMLNPDTLPTPNLLVELLEPFGDDRVGVTEGRQLPFEHSKVANPITGETSWASGCCLMIRRSAFEQVGGYDATTFPLYYDDVDLSWRVRLAGWRIVHASRAAIFHDKRMGDTGVEPRPSERQSSQLAQLLLAYKFGRQDVVDELAASFERSKPAHATDTLREFHRRQGAGLLPTPIAHGDTVADYEGLLAGGHRFGSVGG